MNLVLGARAHMDILNRWENNIMAKFVRFEAGKEREKKLGLDKSKGEFAVVQCALRPIRFYEVAFPEPMLNDVLQLIRPGKSWHPLFNTPINLLRMAMSLEKVPDNPPPDDSIHYMPRGNIEVVGVGIKKDKFIKGIEEI